MHRLLIIPTALISGCATSSVLTTNNPIAERNKDVLILSAIIRDYLSETNGRTFNMNDLMLCDTLKRVSHNFRKIEMETHGGHISVYFNFADSRTNSNLELTDKEIEMLRTNKWSEKDLNYEYDGEIQFEYGERFYHTKKFIVKQE